MSQRIYVTRNCNMSNMVELWRGKPRWSEFNRAWSGETIGEIPLSAAKALGIQLGRVECATLAELRRRAK